MIKYTYRTRLMGEEDWETHEVHEDSFQAGMHEVPLQSMQEMGVKFMLIQGTDRLNRDRFWEFTIKE